MKILSPIQVGFGECYYFCACLLKILLHEFDIKRQKRQRPCMNRKVQTRFLNEVITSNK